ncbi:hypothetical protein D3C87_2089800 [compost metagenome]
MFCQTLGLTGTSSSAGAMRASSPATAEASAIWVALNSPVEASQYARPKPAGPFTMAAR